MMLPMERSEVFKILSDIFRQKDNENKTPLGNITMSESVGNPYDIDFRCEYTGIIVGYLRIVNPPKDCVDGEYCFIYHVPKTQEAGNIAIDSFGSIRVYGDDLVDSFIYHAIKDNANRLADYAKELTLTYQHQVADTVKQVSTEKDEHIGCDEVFQVVVDWLHAMCSCNRIKDVGHIWYTHHTLSVTNSVGCGASKQYVTEELKVSYTPYMKSMMISLGKEHIITIDYLGLGDKSTCVYILKYNQSRIDDVLNKYLVACLAEVLKDRLGMDKLRAYTTAKCTQYTELTHCGPCFFNDDGMTAYVIDPNNVISNETINKNNKPNTILDMKAHIDSLVDKKLKKLAESGSLVYMTKDYLTDQILSQLKNDWQKDVYRSVYSSVWCTLAESRFKIAAFEFEKHFMEYVTLDNDDCFTVRFGLQRIDDNLPGIEIKFHERDEIHVRMIDHKDGAWSRPLIRFHRCESLIYFDTIRKTNCTYKSFLVNVASKIVLLEGLS